VNGPRDLSLGSQIRSELASADRVELLLSFLKFSGLRVIRKELEEFCRRCPGKLRVLTTTYMGATEVEALEPLAAMGADIRISYDTRRTRLHAKAWLFHRDSGFSTGVIGSSNLSQAALLDGCEWNVRLSNIDNGPILAKFQATFDQYWDEGEFEAYDKERFVVAIKPHNPEFDVLASATTLRPYPHQEQALAALTEERERGHYRNLVVAATGTGKTVVAALDYARLRREHGELSLLFVAHRHEILTQSQAVFRIALQDGHFGEKLVGKHKPHIGKHVFASIQSLSESHIADLDPAAYDVVIVDEFHHAAARSYERLLETLTPKFLLGLTATPERADGQSVLHYFDGRIASELRLWDALDRQLLSPFQYFGIHDGTDLSTINWRAGRYDVDSLEHVYTADDVRANAVLRAIRDKIRAPRSMRALGFCASVKHAEYMAEFCSRSGLPSLAVSGTTQQARRKAAVQQLRSGSVNILFTVDLFNEGLDIPMVDTVLFLRPTESTTVFIQQLGRGLRLSAEKDCLTVLDFIGTQNRRFRFDARFRALLHTSRSAVKTAIESGFPYLPAGCDIQLDKESQRAVHENMLNALPLTPNGLAGELANAGDMPLGVFLTHVGIELSDLYRGNRCFTTYKHRAGLREGEAPNNAITRALTRMLHIDDTKRLETFQEWLALETPPESNADDSLMLMLFANLGFSQHPVAHMAEAFRELWSQPDLRAELRELLAELDDQRRRPTRALAGTPFQLHATYSRDEVSAGLREIRKGKLLRTQGGIYRQKSTKTEYIFITLNKDEKNFTPTTLYNDYPISPTRFHWETQGSVREDSQSGLRYQRHHQEGWKMILFVRQAQKDDRGVTMPNLCLGEARYSSHVGEKPMQIIWELETPMPPEFFQQCKLAAG
jgi:superfamily II DNA or RNA helicase